MAKRHFIDLQKEFENQKYFSLKRVKLAVKQMEHQPELIVDARKMMFNKDPQKSMRAAWLMTHAAFEYPELVKKQLPYIIKLLEQPNLHTGTIRSSIRLFQELDMPEKYIGKMFDLCLKYTKNSTLPHGVRAFSINVLGLICKKYPDLKHEVVLVLGELTSFPQPPSINFCIKKTSKILLKL
ncbi:MAG: hypothetical protein SGJ15_06940 [Bacteroidota bacterium]|nr:hypothetical protein [Bacteroidota bacterium]